MGLSSAEKKFLVVTGPPGVGKSTLGNRLEQEAGFAHVDFDKVLVETRRRVAAGLVQHDELRVAFIESQFIKPEVDSTQIVNDLKSPSFTKRENAIRAITFAMTFLNTMLKGCMEYGDMNKNTVVTGVVFSANMRVRMRALEILKAYGIRPALVFLDAPLNVLEAVVAARRTDIDTLLTTGELNDPKLVRVMVENSQPYLRSEGWPKVIKLRREAVRDMVKIRKILRLLS